MKQVWDKVSAKFEDGLGNCRLNLLLPPSNVRIWAEVWDEVKDRVRRRVRVAKTQEIIFMFGRLGL